MRSRDVPCVLNDQFFLTSSSGSDQRIYQEPKMCARLLACPLCSQPGFLTLDALRAGLVSVATRPLACPVCNEVLLGIDKLTIHLFGHTVAQGNAAVGGGNESAKIIEVTSSGNGGVQAIVRSAQTIPVQSWNVLSAAQTLDANSNRQLDEASRSEPTGSSIYIPIDEIETFRNLTALKDDAGNVIPVATGQSSAVDIKAPSQVIFLQNVQTQPKIYSTNLINQTNQSCGQESTELDTISLVNGIVDKPGKESYTQTSWSINVDSAESSPPSEYHPHTDRLADLVKNSQIPDSPLIVYDSTIPQPEMGPDGHSTKPVVKSTRLLSANEKTERCNICGFHFPDRNILALHKQLVHTTREKDPNAGPEDTIKNYPCHLCTKIFKMRGSLMVHMRVAHPGFNSTNVNKEPTLRTDRSSEPPKDVETSSNISDPEIGYNCPTCGKNFKKEQHVTQHLKIHDGKQWECDICSKMFTTKYFLKKHKRLHSGEMPYKCNMCDKTFTFQQSYHKHRLYHKDDKPHTCMTCGRSFKELSTLHNHERIHTGEKPFACETCGKCFRQRVSYLVHRRIHTGVMPYKCASCGKSFRYKVSQRTHKCQQQSFDTDAQQSISFVDELLETSKNKERTDSPFQEERTMDPPVMSEENQYVLVLNEEGQHVLKRKLDVENASKQALNKNIKERSQEDLHKNNEFMQNIWNQDAMNEMEYKNNVSKANEIISNALNSANLWNKTYSDKSDHKISDNRISKQFNVKEINDEYSKGFWSPPSTDDKIDQKSVDKSFTSSTADFFAMVMSPLDREISSPSAEMKHLRLSSPVNNQENSCQINESFSSMNNKTNSTHQGKHDTHVEESFNRSNVHLSNLQTINEDSLKELLYSITDK